MSELEISIFTKPSSSDSIIKYSTSEADPIAICRKRAKSLSDPRPQPSAIFVGIDALALFI